MSNEEVVEKLRKANVAIEILEQEVRRGAAVRDDLRDEIERLKEENRSLRESLEQASADKPVIVLDRDITTAAG